MGSMCCRGSSSRLWDDPDVGALIERASATYGERRMRLIEALAERGVEAQGSSGPERLDCRSRRSGRDGCAAAARLGRGPGRALQAGIERPRDTGDDRRPECRGERALAADLADVLSPARASRTGIGLRTARQGPNGGTGSCLRLPVLRRVFEDGAYAEQALMSEAAELEGRDRALAMRLSYGAVQRRGRLDHLIAGLAGRPAEELDPPLLAALRLGSTSSSTSTAPPTMRWSTTRSSSPSPPAGRVTAW